MAETRNIFPLLILLALPFDSDAQYPSYRQSMQQYAPPIYQLLQRPSTVFRDQLPEQGNMYWDSKTNHYYGNLANRLRYPSMKENGYRYIDLIKTEVSFSNFVESLSSAELLIDRMEMAPQGAHPLSAVYTYDQDLVAAYATESIYPEREAYNRHEESVQYTLKGSRPGLTYTTSDEGSGHGGGTIHCYKLPDFFIRRESGVTKIDFDAFGNTAAYTVVSREEWDTCTCGGPQTIQIKTERNAQGQPLLLTHTDSRNGGLIYEVHYTYQSVPFTVFREQVKGLELYPCFNNKDILNWMVRKKASTVEIVTKTTNTFQVYDPLQQKNVLKTDSPVVSQELYYILLDPARTALAEWTEKPESKGPFLFYETGAKDRDKWTITCTLPAIMHQKDADYCAPLYEPELQPLQAQLRRAAYSALDYGDYTLHHYFSSGGFSSGNFSDLMNPQSKLAADGSIYLFTDKTGLIKYLWNEQNIYKLSYRK